MLWCKRIIWILCWLIVSEQSFASTSDNAIAQRELFQRAEKLAWQPESQQFTELYQKLYFYPLLPYLQQKILLRNVKLSNIKNIDLFLSQYQNSPLDWPLRKKWLAYLAKRQRASLFIKYYQATDDVTLQCQFYRFQLKQGMPEQTVLSQVAKLWLVGQSQPKVCDPLFELWQQKGYLTKQLVWQRLALAANGGKHTLIPYLTGLLPESEQYLGELWHKVRRDPSYIARITRFRQKTAKEQQIYLYGLKRLIWRKPELAIRSYQRAINWFSLSVQQQKQVNKKFAVALASKHHSLADEWLAKVSTTELDADLLHWRLSAWLKQQSWRAIIAQYELLPEQLRSMQWRYWYGKSLIEQDQRLAGEQVLADVANERHYYGFLAASYLQQPIKLHHQAISLSTTEASELLKNNAAKRAFELYALERFTDARREWNYWMSQLTSYQRIKAAKLAHDKGWVDRAIFTLPKQGYLNDLALRFPKPYYEQFNYYAKRHHVDVNWALAIARRESSFMADAHSHVGAKGLMQVMPQTAKHLDRKAHSKRYLLNAKNNIRIGTRYLQQLLGKYQDNIILATAAYNAGPYRVKRWLSQQPKLAADIWIETIPYKETREYVKSVLAYRQIYQTGIDRTGDDAEQWSSLTIGE